MCLWPGRVSVALHFLYPLGLSLCSFPRKTTHKPIDPRRCQTALSTSSHLGFFFHSIITIGGNHLSSHLTFADMLWVWMTASEWAPLGLGWVALYNAVGHWDSQARASTQGAGLIGVRREGVRSWGRGQAQECWHDHIWAQNSKNSKNSKLKPGFLG